MIIVEQLPAAAPPRSTVDPLPLTWEQRNRTRQQVTSRGGRVFGLKLSTGTRLPPGTVVYVGDGFHVQIIAETEDVWLLPCGNPQQLARIAYALGNRHLAIELGADYIAVLYDHTLQELWERLGAHADRVRRPFLPDHCGLPGHG